MITQFEDRLKLKKLKNPVPPIKNETQWTGSDVQKVKILAEYLVEVLTPTNHIPGDQIDAVI